MLTPERLRAIRERCERATPGPWVGNYAAAGYHVVVSDREGALVGYLCKHDDVKFVTHARDDMPDLVAEVERLHALLSDLRNLMGSWRREAARCRRKADDAIDSTTFACFDSKAVALSEAASDLEDVLNRLEAKQHA